MKYKYTCAWCKVVFTPNVKRKDRKFCSQYCLLQAKHKLRTKSWTKCKCKRCGKLFYTPKYKSWNGRGKYCSRVCCDAGDKSTLPGGKRRCAKCHKIKLLSNFGKNGHLHDGTAKSDCYCRSCRKHLRRAAMRSTSQRFTAAVYNAGRRKYCWKISFNLYVVLLEKPCGYCGGKLPRSGTGLDRKDNSLGYTKNNVIPCCGVCNWIKGDKLTYQEMLQLAPILYSIRMKRPNSNWNKLL